MGGARNRQAASERLSHPAQDEGGIVVAGRLCKLLFGCSVCVVVVIDVGVITSNGQAVYQIFPVALHGELQLQHIK